MLAQRNVKSEESRNRKSFLINLVAWRFAQQFFFAPFNRARGIQSEKLIWEESSKKVRRILCVFKDSYRTWVDDGNEGNAREWELIFVWSSRHSLGMSRRLNRESLQQRLQLFLRGFRFRACHVLLNAPFFLSLTIQPLALMSFVKGGKVKAFAPLHGDVNKILFIWDARRKRRGRKASSAARLSRHAQGQSNRFLIKWILTLDVNIPQTAATAALEYRVALNQPANVKRRRRAGREQPNSAAAGCEPRSVMTWALWKAVFLLAGVTRVVDSSALWTLTELLAFALCRRAQRNLGIFNHKLSPACVACSQLRAS
jgi:hypothetical protein